MCFHLLFSLIAPLFFLDAVGIGVSPARSRAVHCGALEEWARMNTACDEGGGNGKCSVIPTFGTR